MTKVLQQTMLNAKLRKDELENDRKALWIFFSFSNPYPLSVAVLKTWRPQPTFLGGTLVHTRECIADFISKVLFFSIVLFLETTWRMGTTHFSLFYLTWDSFRERKRQTLFIHIIKWLNNLQSPGANDYYVNTQVIPETLGGKSERVFPWEIRALANACVH